MNTPLSNRLKALSQTELDYLLQAFAGAPVMLQYIGFLKSKSGSGQRMAEAVQYVYHIKPQHPGYPRYENRIYKLRKKLTDYLNHHQQVPQSQLPEEQQWVSESGRLMQAGKFGEAHTLLSKAEKQCWLNNIFELLPEVLDMLIQCNQALNNIALNKKLHGQFVTGLGLYNDLMEAKNITRRIYEINFTQGITAAVPLYARLKKLAYKHAAYPRFRLIYNFVAGYYKTGAGSNYYMDKTNIITRHITAAKNIMLQYPGMPALYYTVGFRYTQLYRLNEVQAMSYYNALRYKDAANQMEALYTQVMAPDSSYSRMKNEVLFTNTIHMLIADSRFEKAIEVAKDFMHFIKENKHYQRLLMVYCEQANILIGMYPARPVYDAQLLLEKLDEYINSTSPGNQPGDPMAGMVLKVKLLGALHRFAEAEAILKKIPATIFSDEAVYILTKQCYQLLQKTANPSVMHDIKNEVKRLRLKANRPEAYGQLLLLEKLLAERIKVQGK